jgi:hypothetical protein
MTKRINPLTGLPMTDIDMLQFRNTNTVGAGQQALLDSSGQMTKQTPNTGGLAETGANKSWTDTIASLFKPQGTAGTSTGGNIMDTIGIGVEAGTTGLAGYLAYKNHEAQKEQQERENKIQDKALARVDNMQKNYDASTRVVG